MPVAGRRRSVPAALVAACLVGALGVISIPAAFAAEIITVNTVEDLQAAVASATADRTVILGDGFPQDLPAEVTLTSSGSAVVEIDGDGKTVQSPGSGRHFTLNVSGTGALILRDLALTLTGGGTGVSR